MPAKLSQPLHLPRLSREARLGFRTLSVRLGGAVSRPCDSMQAASASAAVPALLAGWRRRAVKEGVVATLLTSLLTSAVLAAPEAFRQSPAVTWRQLTIPALALEQRPGMGVLVDCP